jgi:hypothetical protein
MHNTNSETVGISVTVDGKDWSHVPSLANSAPGDCVFALTQTPDGKSVVEFGDGIQGAELPTGSAIEVTYRSGAGAAGNQVTVRLERTKSHPTLDQALWVAIRNRTRAISFEFHEQSDSIPRLERD